MTADLPPALLWGLRRYLAAPHATVTALHRQPFEGGLSGSTLEYWRLHLRRAGVQQTITLIYKRGAVVAGAFLRGAPQREALAYANLPGKIPLDTPTAVAFDIAAGDLWLLPFPASKHSSHWLADWSRADVEAALTDLARLHLAFWDAPAKLAQMSWLARPAGADSAALLADARAGLDAIVADDALTPARLADLQALAAAPAILLDPLVAGPLTLLHGDAGFQNIAITQDGRQRLWYDWQLVSAGPPALDLVTFLHPWAYPDASPPLSLAAMIDFYLAALQKRGRSLDPAQFRRQLDAALLWRWLIQWAPLLGAYRARLRPHVRARLVAVFEALHWPALERVRRRRRSASARNIAKNE